MHAGTGARNEIIITETTLLLPGWPRRSQASILSVTSQRRAAAAAYLGMRTLLTPLKCCFSELPDAQAADVYESSASCASFFSSSCFL